MSEPTDWDEQEAMIGEQMATKPTESSEITWGYNCLTTGIHHGRQEILWNLPLFQALSMFTAYELKDLVINRIYTDALIIVHRGPEPRPSQEWAEKIKKYAEELFPNLFQQKIGELSNYYQSGPWRQDVQVVINRVKDNRLNPNYHPLHSHDSINMLCRIIGTSAVHKAARESEV